MPCIELIGEQFKHVVPQKSQCRFVRREYFQSCFMEKVEFGLSERDYYWREMSSGHVEWTQFSVSLKKQGTVDAGLQKNHDVLE